MDSALQAQWYSSLLFSVQCAIHTAQKHTAEIQKSRQDLPKQALVLYQTILIKEFVFYNPPGKMHLNKKFYISVKGWLPCWNKPGNRMGYDKCT